LKFQTQSLRTPVIVHSASPLERERYTNFRENINYREIMNVWKVKRGIIAIS